LIELNRGFSMNLMIITMMLALAMDSLASAQVVIAPAVISVLGTGCNQPWNGTDENRIAELDADKNANHFCSPFLATRISDYESHATVTPTCPKIGFYPVAVTAKYECRPAEILSCTDCHNQPQPSEYCKTTCGCTSAFCGSW
jgi:hypothetical protein